MTTEQAPNIAGLLADAARRKVFAAIELGSTQLRSIVATTGLAEAAVVKALDRLMNAGLVIADTEGFSLNTELIDAQARVHRERQPGVDVSTVDQEEAAVIRSFFKDGRLVSYPAQHKKQLVILDLLAQRFDPGKTYPEAQVNLMLAEFFPDTALLRRSLVDNQLLERRDGFYWRAGGTFEVD
jgi:hypothetical protein